MAIDQYRFMDALNHVKEHQPNNPFFHRLIGVENSDEATYFENLHLFQDELAARNVSCRFQQNGLNSAIDIQHTQTMNRFWSTVTKLKEPSSETIVKVTFGYRNSVLINEQLDKLISNSLSKTLDVFRENQRNIEVIKNFYIALTFWVEVELPLLFGKEEITVTDKTYVYWGSIKRNEAYFLLFLSFLGVQTVYFNPFSADGTEKVNRIAEHTTTYEWSGKKQLSTIPSRVQRTKTIASKAQKEIHDVLHTDSTGIYKPWQFEEYVVRTTPLQTTLEELFILWNEPAKFRTGFSVQAKEVFIPNIFAKISGVPEDMQRFWDEYSQLKSSEQTIFYHQLPITSSISYHNQNIVLKNNRFAEEEIKRMREYDFHHLRPSIQKGIIDAMNELIMEEEFFHNVDKKRDFPNIVLHTVLKLETNLVTLLQTFDYSDKIPKIVVFDGQKSTFSIHDAILLGFLHKIGLDVVVLTPTGYQNLERFIDPRFFDHHKREKFVFDLTVQQYETNQKSWFSKWFKN